MGDKGKEQLCTGSNEESREKNLSVRKHQHRGGSTDGKSVAPHDNLEGNTSAEDIDRRREDIKGGVSDFMASLPDNKQIVPYGIVSNDLWDESSVVFGALHMLRLSRSDIIRWLRSPIKHTTLDGFFVRLRFGKWEEALGGTGYHVARLNGALDWNRLSVTIRNSTCQVDSRFVSNHDFHEVT
uniref:Plus3 domain-containing protein n=1 Tax=Arundo donax TaxID=35708 RepID=A0A0A9E8C3_ARUDO